MTAPPTGLAPLPLARVQAWVQAVLVHPGGAAAGLASPEAASVVPPGRESDVVKGRGAMTAADRLEIYASMYPLRMRDALAGDYPALAALLGDDGFEALVHAYVAAHPSRSFTLARLGDSLPAFVAGWGAPRRRGLLADVALLELDATRVFDADEAAPVEPSALERIDPDAWPSIRLVPVPAFAVRRARTAALDAVDALSDGSPLPARPAPGRGWALLFRRRYEVKRRRLEPAAGRLLTLLAAGEPLGAALARAARSRRDRPDPETLMLWFREWVALGLFAEVRVEPG